MFNEKIDLMKNDIIKSTQDLVKIPSVLAESSDSTMPFGKEINNALEFALNLGEQLGFRTKNIDGYCGYIEFGEGDELVGIIGHLDVVPEGEGWNFPPFSATIHNNKIYGRGAIDDKGPVIASLYAMKAVMDTCKVNKRVRLILGLNEENDWKCIDYYKLHEEIPNVGFSPDADFPCIYAEKGILTTVLKQEYTPYTDDLIFIEDINSFNNAINVVPKLCEATLHVNTNKVSIDNVFDKLNEIIKKYEYNINVTVSDSSHLKITSHGISAHAAFPDLGDNAISKLLIVLNDIFSAYKLDIEILTLFKKYINTELNGQSLNINVPDESGDLTLNVGHFGFSEDFIEIGLNLRVPVNTKLNDIEISFEKLTKDCENISVEFNGKKEPLYVPKDSPLVQTLCKIFTRVSGIDAEPVAIGGGTYARGFDNFVSFGANMPEQQDLCHQVNEYMSIDNLILCSKIYAEAIYELAK